MAQLRRSLVWLSLPLLGVACGDDGGQDSSTTAVTTLTTGVSGASTTSTTASVPTTGDDAGSLTDAATGTTGTTDMPTTSGTTSAAACDPACESGFECLDGACCDPMLVCDGVCCGAGQTCSFGACVMPGADCVDASDCEAGEYCDYALGDPVEPPPPECMGGGLDKQGKCLPSPPECRDGMLPDPDNVTCIAACEYVPPPGNFALELRYELPDLESVSPPIVIQLDDDDCDGKVTENDIPEIIVSHFEPIGGLPNGTPGTISAVSVVDGELVTKWSAPGMVAPAALVAAGDIDGDGVAEVVTCAAPSGGDARNTGVIAFKADGTVLWQQNDTTKVHCGYDAPALADPLQTGNPMVLVGFTLLDGATGAIVQELEPSIPPGVYINGFMDVDDDGQLDIVSGQRAYNIAGGVIWDLSVGPDQIPAGYHGVGDLDLDGLPEIVVVSPSAPFSEPVSGQPHVLSLLRADVNSPDGVEVLRSAIDLNAIVPPLSPFGGGPPIVADFDGDGFPDVGTATSSAYVVLSGKLLMDPNVADADTFLWTRMTRDKSSAVTGSSVFDFEGDGSAEVLYSDEINLWVYAGKDGADLLPKFCNTTGTLWEYPVVADVDNDGQADVLVVSNDYYKDNLMIFCDGGATTRGLRIYGSPNDGFVRTRRVWNQHTYHISNINEDGTIPAVEATNWQEPGLNNYRQNKQPGGAFSAPDAIVSLLYPKCSGVFSLVATVRNLGAAVLPPGAQVSFYKGAQPNGELLGTAATQLVLFPAQAEQVAIELGDMHPDVQDGTVDVYAVVETQAVECRTDNNSSAQESGACIPPG